MQIDIKNNSNFFWRIIFTLLVALLHSDFITKTGNGWYLAVDYFFMLSGFWLVDSYERKRETTGRYIRKRILKLWPHQLFSFLAIFTWYHWGESVSDFAANLLTYAGEALPFTYFLFDSEYAGGGYPYNFPVWYLSVLLLVSWILYYLVKHHKSFSINVIVPCAVFLGGGYLYRQGAGLNTGNNVGLFLNDYYIRGFMDMCIGVLLYYIVMGLKEYLFRKSFFVCARVAEIVCFGSVIVISYHHGGKNDMWYILIMSIGILCSFLYADKTFINTKVMRRLNDLMYPVYLNHIFVIILLWRFNIRGASLKNVVIYIILLTAYSCFTGWFVKKICNLAGKIKVLFILENSKVG